MLQHEDDCCVEAKLLRLHIRYIFPDARQRSIMIVMLENLPDPRLLSEDELLDQEF